VIREATERDASPPPNRWARRRHLVFVALTAFGGFVFFRGSYFALRDRGPAVWALALMLAVLAAACWALTFSLIRSRRAPRAAEPEPAPHGQLSDGGATTPDTTP
jgi:drug/metabolite transporter (DMT)-like permease